MNFVVAVAIGVVVGLVGWFVIRQRQPNAIWLGPVLGVLGAVLASSIATAVSTPGYGWKEIALQIALAVFGVGVLAAMALRRPAASGETTASTAE